MARSRPRFAPEFRKAAVYADGVFFGRVPPREGEIVLLVRGAGPREGTAITGAVVRRHPDDGRLWVHADAGWPEPRPVITAEAEAQP